MKNQNEKESREKFKIIVDDLEVEPGVAQTNYVLSSEIQQKISELFKSVFADYEGCIFEVSNGEPTISLLFNRKKYDEDERVGSYRIGANSGSSVIDRRRNQDRQMQEGDRYYLTDDAKDVVSDLLIPRLYNNGNINWKLIVSDYQERNQNNYYMMPNQIPVYTKVSGLSLNRILNANLLEGFASKDKDGNKVEHGATLAAPLNYMNYQQGSVYVLTITTITVNNLNKIYEKLGFGSAVSGIIR